jgi:hypothetical protein
MPYDLIIRNGRVIDPQTNFDTICDVAVAGGCIAAIGTGLGRDAPEIDATGLVGAPGFIDLHAHGQARASSVYLGAVTRCRKWRKSAIPTRRVSAQCTNFSYLTRLLGVRSCDLEARSRHDGQTRAGYRHRDRPRAPGRPLTPRWKQCRRGATCAHAAGRDRPRDGEGADGRSLRG